ncbi:MAG: hypothetical protein KTR14_05700 [Vampirovibrio sp.]|nr:hypothetical protein [Vampirovibrio sp.]
MSTPNIQASLAFQHGYQFQKQFDEEQHKAYKQLTLGDMKPVSAFMAKTWQFAPSGASKSQLGQAAVGLAKAMVDTYDKNSDGQLNFEEYFASSSGPYLEIMVQRGDLDKVKDYIIQHTKAAIVPIKPFAPAEFSAQFENGLQENKSLLDDVLKQPRNTGQKTFQIEDINGDKQLDLSEIAVHQILRSSCIEFARQASKNKPLPESPATDLLNQFLSLYQHAGVKLNEFMDMKSAAIQAFLASMQAKITNQDDEVFVSNEVYHNVAKQALEDPELQIPQFVQQLKTK